MWDFGSGQLYKRFPEQSVKTKENSITGLLFHTIDNTRCILASAWGKQITIFEVRLLLSLLSICNSFVH